MLDRLTLTMAAMALAKECRKASEAQDWTRMVDNADAIKAIAHEAHRQQAEPGNIQPPIRIAGWQMMEEAS